MRSILSSKWLYLGLFGLALLATLINAIRGDGRFVAPPTATVTATPFQPRVATSTRMPRPTATITVVPPTATSENILVVAVETLQPNIPTYDYIVASGDTLTKIDERCGYSWGVTERLNTKESIPNPNIIHVGQVIKVPCQLEEGSPPTSAFPESVPSDTDTQQSPPDARTGISDSGLNIDPGVAVLGILFLIFILGLVFIPTIGK